MKWDKLQLKFKLISQHAMPITHRLIERAQKTLWVLIVWIKSASNCEFLHAQKQFTRTIVMLTQ